MGRIVSFCNRLQFGRSVRCLDSILSRRCPASRGILVCEHLVDLKEARKIRDEKKEVKAEIRRRLREEREKIKGQKPVGK